MKRLPSLLLLASVILGSAPFAAAYPSGGPYGPLEQRYEIPKDARRVLFVSPEGKAEAKGDSLATPTSLEQAIAQAESGDAIILRGGTYRTGGLKTNQGITLQAYADEQPVLKGTRVATDWAPLRKGLWRTRWTSLFPKTPQDWWRREREGMFTPPHRFNNDMVFIDGVALQSAGWEGEVDANSYFIDYEKGWVVIGTDPTKRLVEITAHDGALTRVLDECHGKKSDGKGFILRGLTLTQYAYRALEVDGYEPESPMKPGTFGKDVVGTTLEHVTITHCSRVAAYLRGDGITLRHCRISDTSTEGIYILASADCLLEKNIFARNNVEKITGYFPSAVKIFNQSHRVVCRDNLVIDNPDSNGIWWDVGNRDGVFVDNWVVRAQAGFFYEISRDAVCEGNVFVDCEQGVYVLNSSGVKIRNNTFVNSMATFERTERSAANDHFGWHPAAGPDIPERDGHAFTGNLLVASADYSKAILQFRQSDKLTGKITKPQSTEINGNVYVRQGEQTVPLILWAPASGEKSKLEFKSLEEFQALEGGFEKNGLFRSGVRGAVFRSAELGHYEPVLALPKAGAYPAAK